MTYEINFFGWCSEDKHDKVWGYVTVQGDEIYRFWGRRGNRFSFAKEEGSWRTSDLLQKAARDKTKPGRRSGQYIAVPVHEIEEVWNNFYSEFEHQLIAAKLSGIFRYGGEIEEVD